MSNIKDLALAAATALAGAQAAPDDADLAKANEEAQAALAAAEEAAGKKAAPKKEKESTVPVRILCDHGDFTVDSVENIPASQVDGAVEAGWADPSPEAVTYARSLAEAG